MIRPSRVTVWAAMVAGAAIAFTAGFLLVRYPTLPSLLTVHFRRNGAPDGWQYKTYWRVFLPVFLQLALALTLGSIGALLLSRPHGTHDEGQADVKAALVAAEGVVLMTTVWVVFQGYAAAALAMMWQRERAGLGAAYTYLEGAGIAITIFIAVRTHLRLGRPAPRPFVKEHWWLGQLYRNAADPALFVPTLDGSRWTLNFGRPVAVALAGVALAVGVIGPTIILGLLLR